MKVRLQKISESAKPDCKAASWDHHVAGSFGILGQSLPVQYTVEGELPAPLVVGYPISMRRSKRNGIDALGLFISSVVVKIEGDTIETRNSIYKIEYLEGS